MTEIDTSDNKDESKNASNNSSLDFQSSLTNREDDLNPKESNEKENNTDRHSSTSSLKHAEVEREEIEEVHEVELTVTLTACFPLENERDSTNDSTSTKQRLTEGPKPLNFYKLEYQLLPNDPDTLFVADLVTYKTAAKLYPENVDPKVIKPWQHENKMWITWNQTHKLKLTRTSLLRLFEHEFVLKIWDSRDFCSARTKFDRPKPFKFPKTEEFSDDYIKSLIIEQCDKYLKQIPKEIHNKLNRRLPNQEKEPDEFDLIQDNVSNTLIAIKLSTNTSLDVGNKLSELANDTTLDKSVKSLKNSINLDKVSKKSHQQPASKAMSKMSKRSSISSVDMTSSNMAKKRDNKSRKELATELDFIKKNGSTRLKLKMKILFAGYSYIMTRLDESVSTIDDFLVTISLNNQCKLMSDRQLNELNPLCIRLEKLADLPNEPISYDQLRQKCERVYCNYEFFNQTPYKSESLVHEKNIYFNDINVYLAGLLNKEELNEYFNACSFQVEIHDRDRREQDSLKQPAKACLFGKDANDSQIGSVNSITAKHTIHNPFKLKHSTWNPYGIARFNLHEFLLGKRLIEFNVPVLPCNAPDLLERKATNSPKTSLTNNNKDLGERDPTQAIQPGHYLDANTHLKVTMFLAKPLFNQCFDSCNPYVRQSIELQAEVQNQVCVFGRIVAKIALEKYKIIKVLLEMVREINGYGLGLGEYSVAIQEAALSTYKLNENEQVDKELDIVTGFHLIDANYHIFVLEGLKTAAIKRIYERLCEYKNDEGLDLLYNSTISFSNRLYALLDVDLIKVKLFESLENIVRKPLLYVRDMAPKDSFEALIKLHHLLAEYRLRSVVRCDLFPSAQGVLSMSKEFGIPLTESELEQLKSDRKLNTFTKQTDSDMADEIYGLVQTEPTIPHTSRFWTPIDHQNDQYLEIKKEKQSEKPPNFLKQNVKLVAEIADKNKNKRPIKNYIYSEGPFNYSSQTLNSTELALNKYREKLSEANSNDLYSYNPEFHHSMTFVPVNLEKVKKDESAQSVKRWVTKEGWSYPGFKSSQQANEHPRKLDQASLDKLKESWEDNLLHAYKMKSPLTRNFYKHSMRKLDFDIWSKPSQETIVPLSIFESTVQREKYEKDLNLVENEKWKKSLKINESEVEVKTHRLLAQTELTETGLKSSNQMDKLKGLLKGEPKKSILVYKGVNFNQIPALSVTNEKFELTEPHSKGYTSGGVADLRLTDDRNRIPIKDLESEKFCEKRGQDFRSYIQPTRQIIYKGKSSTIDENVESANQQLKSSIYVLPNKEDMDRFRMSSGKEKNEKLKEVTRRQETLKSSNILGTAY